MDRAATAKLVSLHEGTRYKAYKDTVGILTVAIGFNLEKEDARGRIVDLGLDYDAVCNGTCELTDGHVDTLFQHDLNAAIQAAERSVHNFDIHPNEVQTAIVDMVYNLGEGGFRKFADTIAALEANPPDYCTAAEEMKDSKWAKQVPNRVADDIALVKQFCK
jgi:lysozyme